MVLGGIFRFRRSGKSSFWNGGWTHGSSPGSSSDRRRFILAGIAFLASGWAQSLDTKPARRTRGSPQYDPPPRAHPPALTRTGAAADGGLPVSTRRRVPSPANREREARRTVVRCPIRKAPQNAAGSVEEGTRAQPRNARTILTRAARGQNAPSTDPFTLRNPRLRALSADDVCARRSVGEVPD